MCIETCEGCVGGNTGRQGGKIGGQAGRQVGIVGRRASMPKHTYGLCTHMHVQDT